MTIAQVAACSCLSSLGFGPLSCGIRLMSTHDWFIRESLLSYAASFDECNSLCVEVYTYIPVQPAPTTAADF